METHKFQADNFNGKQTGSRRDKLNKNKHVPRGQNTVETRKQNL